MSIIAIIFTVLLVISGIGLVIFVLLHSGKGTGLSDMIAAQVYNNQTGSGTVEKNLDRITIILAAVFMISQQFCCVFQAGIHNELVRRHTAQGFQFIVECATA